MSQSAPPRDRVYFIRIDYDKLREALDPPGPLRLSEDDLQDWLLDHGFRIGLKGWYASGPMLQKLNPQVIISCNPVA